VLAKELKGTNPRVIHPYARVMTNKRSEAVGQGVVAHRNAAVGARTNAGTPVFLTEVCDRTDDPCESM